MPSMRQAQYWDDKRLSENILMHDDRTYQLPWVLFVSCVTMLSQLCQQLFNGKKDGYELLCCCVQKLLKIRRDGRVEGGRGVGDYLV